MSSVRHGEGGALQDTASRGGLCWVFLGRGLRAKASSSPAYLSFPRAGSLLEPQPLIGERAGSMARGRTPSFRSSPRPAPAP